MAATYAVGQYPHMTKEITDAFVKGLKIIVDDEHHKMKPLSLRAGMAETGVRDLFRNDSAPKVNNAHELAKALGRTVDEIIQIGNTGVITPSEAPYGPKVAVAGRAGAGDEIHLTDDFAKGDGLYHVERPPQLPPNGIVAVEVSGDSMEPAYADGDILFYTRYTADGVPTEAIDKKVIAETDDGRVWVKQIKLGAEPGLFHLLSLNPTGPNMHNVRIKWAAPVRLHLPYEFVKRVG